VTDIDIAIVGAGFGGLGAAIRLRQAGFTDFLLFDAGEDVGGTWRDNTYPGCACDVPSHLYSFSFARNPDWSNTFSGQAEIWAYLRMRGRLRAASAPAVPAPRPRGHLGPRRAAVADRDVRRRVHGPGADQRGRAAQ